jgi:hypothetical protein
MGVSNEKMCKEVLLVSNLPKEELIKYVLNILLIIK